MTTPHATVPNRATSWVAAAWAVAAGVCAALHVGKLPAAIPLLQAELGLGLTQAAALLSMVQVGGLLLGLVAGAAVQRVGLRRSLIGGLVGLSLGAAAGAAAPNALVLIATRALEGLGFLAVVVSAPALVRRHVPASSLGAAMGAWGAYMPAGTALALAAGAWFLQATSWRLWWLALAVVTALMALGAARWIPTSPPNQGNRVAAPGASWATPLRWPLAWALALCFGCYSAQWLAVVGFLPSVAVQAGGSLHHATSLTALVAAVNIVGNLAGGWALQRGVAPTRLIAMALVAMAVCCAVGFGPWLHVAQAWPLRFGAIALFSMVGGLIPSSLFALAMRHAPHDGLAAGTLGWMQQVSAAGQFAGPWTVATLASATGQWHWTAAFSASCGVLGLGLVVWISRLQHRNVRV
jgi:MFS transporter, CP family, cyanate transporter